MDTKLKSNNSNKTNKSNKSIGVLIGVLLIAVLTVVIISFYNPIYKNTQLKFEQHKSQASANEILYKDSLIDDLLRTLYKSNFTLYLDVLQKGSNSNLKPADIFLTEYMNGTQSSTNSSREVDIDINDGYPTKSEEAIVRNTVTIDKNGEDLEEGNDVVSDENTVVSDANTVVSEENNADSEATNVNSEEIVAASEENEVNSEDIYDNEELNYEKEDFRNNFNAVLLNWYQLFYTETLRIYPSFSYYVIDNNTGKELTNSVDSLSSLMTNTTDSQKLKDAFPFYIILKSGTDRKLSITDYKGLERKEIDEFLSIHLNNRILLEDIGYDGFYKYNDQITIPPNITIIYASHADNFYDTGRIVYDNYYNPAWIFVESGFGYLYVAVILGVLLFALLLPFKKSLCIGTGYATRVPFEINAAAMLVTLVSVENLATMVWESINCGFIFDSDFTVLSEQMQIIISYGFHVFVWMTILFIWYFGFLSMRQIFSLGPIRYLKEKTLTGRCLRFIYIKLKNVFQNLSEVDLSAKSNKIIIKILIINYIILALICCVWIFGIALLVPYTIIVFFLIRKRLEDIKNKYNQLLESTSKIASGIIDVSIEENLGIFEPLKEELAKVQQGFIKAVKEETKSERMKTELITNVSHDLKTPLTAIITYIGLLKEENVTDEERKTYIETLDMKSQRLKRLIEDLFEVSKAASNNITLSLVDVDLVNLIKQALLELDDKIKLSNIEFRLNLPEEKVILTLDSEKTYRIFENLIINITKYAMPHTRAYIDLAIKTDTVIVTIKNISSTELNFSTEEITERFVRGDLSRNTEGSGLGLAITKSFVELQGGQFTIIADGDLFKAIIEWKRD